jgi:hypothetical protein
MATAVYWYERLAIKLNQHDNATDPGRCGDERPGAYKTLCERTSGSVPDLLWAKARLHLNWAMAGIVFQRNGNVCRPLDDIAV